MRVVLRLLSPLLGLAVAAAGLLIAVETATAWLAPASSPLVVPWTTWRTTLDGLTWTSGAVRTTAVVLGILGLLVLGVGLAARRHDVRLTDPVPEVTITTSPRSVARAVGHDVRTLAEVISASVVASTARITVHASTDATPAEVETTVRERVDEALGRIPLARRPSVRVSVTSTRVIR